MLTMLIFMVVAMVALSYFGRRQNAKAEHRARPPGRSLRA